MKKRVLWIGIHLFTGDANPVLVSAVHVAIRKLKTVIIINRRHDIE
jgi:hypothetical protein